MQQFTLPVFLGGLTAIIVLLSGLVGGVGFGLIVKRMLIFSIILGGIGFLIHFLLQKWGFDLSSPSELKNLDRNGDEKQEGEEGESSGNENNQGGNESVSLLSQDVSGGKKDYSGDNKKAGETENVFDYTVKDDEEIEFKPLDESLLEKKKKQFIDYQGEKIEYDPKRAAQAIRQLLKEDHKDGE